MSCSRFRAQSRAQSRSHRVRTGLLAALLATGLTAGAQAGTLHPDSDPLVPTGRGWGERPTHPGQASSSAYKSTGSNGILYHGGPLLNAATGTNIYYIWYGNWTGNNAPTILGDFITGLSGSPWYNINTSYGDAAGVKVTNRLTLAGSTTDNYSQGTKLSDSGVWTVVSKAIQSGRLPKDPKGVYFVLTSKDVNETSGFCTQYCGWHSSSNYTGTALAYAFVGNPDRCPSACAAQTTSPNGNAGADAMASLIGHELSEAVTDPQFTGWYDTRGNENGDKCAWNFGTTYQTANGSYANVRLGSRDFLLQQNWVNANGGACALSY
jgi:hypothetical protein